MNKIKKLQCIRALKRGDTWENEMGVILKLAHFMGRLGAAHYDEEVAAMLAVDGSKGGDVRIGWVVLLKTLREAGKRHGIHR